MDFDKNLLQYVFIVESKEFLTAIESDFLELEKCDKTIDPSLINKLFRAFHTIKGSANCIGMTTIGKLSHEVETLLSLMRSGRLLPKTIHIDAMLDSADALNTMLDDINNSNSFDVSIIISSLKLMIEECGSKDEKESDFEEKKNNVVTKEISLEKFIPFCVEGFEINDQILSDCPSAHDYLYVLEYEIDDIEDKDKIFMQLINTGKVIEVKITSFGEKQQDSDQNTFKLLYSTVLDESLLTLAISPAPSKLVELKKSGFTPKTDIDVTANSVLEEIPKETPVENLEIKNSLIKERRSDSITETIRINVDTLDQLMKLAGELVLIRNQQLLNVDRSDPIFRSIVQQLDVVTTKLQEAIMRTRMQPIGKIFGKIPRIIRELEKKLDKQVEVSIIGSDVELDKGVLEALAEPIPHLIRNCCDHGLEMPEIRIKAGKSPIGKISIETFHKGGQINIIISDDGKGISTIAIKRKAVESGLKSDAELNLMNEKQLYSLIFQPGFSTADTITDVSGRGVGMDVVKNAIEKVGGSIELKSISGKGTTVHLRMPLTLAIIPCLIVRVDGFRYAIPQINLEELICLYNDDVRTKIECAGNFEIYRLRDKLLPLVRLSEILDRKSPFTDETFSEISEKYRLQQKQKYNEYKKHSQDNDQEFLRQSLNFAVVKVGSNRFGLIIDEIEGTEEIVIKPLHSSMKKLICFSGATVMGDGKVVLILNIDGIARFARIAFSTYLKKYDDIQKVEMKGKLETILLFESGKNEHFAIPLPFVRRIERILMSDIDIIGDKEYIIIDGVSTRILRLEHVLDVSPCIENKEMSVILPKNIDPQIGILISNVINIEKTHLNVTDIGYCETGVIATSIIRDHTTLLLELYSLIEKAEPFWFREKRRLEIPNSDKINILLIENDPFYKKLFIAYLKPEKYSLTIASNGQDALEKLKQKKIHLIITNIYMSIMNGWEFVANIRQEPEYSKIPVIGLDDLDKTSSQDKEKATKLEFKGFESKIDRESLLNKIIDVLSSTNKPDEKIYNE